MKLKRKYILIGSTIGVASIGLPTAIASAIIIPKVSGGIGELKEGLRSFALDTSYNPFEDPNNVWKQNKPIRYVAIGDSLSAGFNGALDYKDSLSFPLFLANNLKNSNKLASFKDLSKSAETIWSGYYKMTNSLKNSHVLKDKADLISVSIGSNDLLSALNILKFSIPYNEIDFPMQFNDFLKMFEKFTNTDEDHNNERKKININKGLKDHKKIYDKKHEVGNAHQPLNEGELSWVIKESIKQFVKAYKKKEWHETLKINEEWLEKDKKKPHKIFQFITRGLVTLFKDLNDLNPKAKILFIAPANPFHWLPDKIKNKKQAGTNLTLLETFEELKKAMKKACEVNMAGKNHIVDYIESEDLIPKANLKRLDHPNYATKNAFNNILDVHPSIYGNQLIGEGVFKHISPHLNIKKPEEHFTKTYPYNHNSEWARLDENPEKLKLDLQKAFFKFLNGEGNFFVDVLKIIKPLIPIDDHKENLQKIINKFKDLKYDDYVPIVELLKNDLILDLVIDLLKNKRLKTKILDLVETAKKVAKDYDNSYSKYTWIYSNAPKLREKIKPILEELNQFPKLPKEKQDLLLNAFKTALNKFNKSGKFNEATTFIKEILNLMLNINEGTGANWITKHFSSSFFEKIVKLFINEDIVDRIGPIKNSQNNSGKKEVVNKVKEVAKVNSNEKESKTEDIIPSWAINNQLVVGYMTANNFEANLDNVWMSTNHRVDFSKRDLVKSGWSDEQKTKYILVAPYKGSTHKYTFEVTHDFSIKRIKKLLKN